jgi:hypothetical protein
VEDLSIKMSSTDAEEGKNSKDQDDGQSSPAACVSVVWRSDLVFTHTLTFLGTHDIAQVAAVCKEYRARVSKAWRLVLPVVRDSTVSSLWVSLFRRWQASPAVLRATVEHWFSRELGLSALLVSQRLGEGAARSKKWARDGPTEHSWVPEHPASKWGVMFARCPLVHLVTAQLIAASATQPPMPRQERDDWLQVLERVIGACADAAGKKEEKKNGGVVLNGEHSNNDSTSLEEKKNNIKKASGVLHGTRASRDVVNRQVLKLAFTSSKDRHPHWAAFGNAKCHDLVAGVLVWFRLHGSHVLWEALALLVAYGADVGSATGGLHSAMGVCETQIDSTSLRETQGPYMECVWKPAHMSGMHVQRMSSGLSPSESVMSLCEHEDQRWGSEGEKDVCTEHKIFAWEQQATTCVFGVFGDVEGIENNNPWSLVQNLRRVTAANAASI